jgi:anthranilate synthase component 1
MQHLSTLEPERRGIYAGALGYFDLAGNTNTCIAIRSALIKGGNVHIQAGAGIVYDSQPIAEYEETRNKAKSVVKAVYWAEQSAK